MRDKLQCRNSTPYMYVLTTVAAFSLYTLLIKLLLILRRHLHLISWGDSQMN